MKKVVSSDLLLYADDFCLVFQHKHVIEIETHLNNSFSNLCEWFLDNKRSIHFREDKTKFILFGTKRKLRKVGKLNFTYQGIDIKQNSQVTFLGCILDETMSSEPMVYKTIKKINPRLSYLFRKSTFWHQVSGGSYATPWFSRILIMRALRGIQIFTKNLKIKFKVLRINVFDFVSILIRCLIYHKMSSKN